MDTKQFRRRSVPTFQGVRRAGGSVKMRAGWSRWRHISMRAVTASANLLSNHVALA